METLQNPEEKFFSWKTWVFLLQQCFTSPCSSVSEESVCNAGDLGSGRPHRGGTGNPPQYSCLENSMDRGAWWATVHGVVRVRHGLVTKPPSPPAKETLFWGILALEFVLFSPLTVTYTCTVWYILMFITRLFSP